MRLFQDTQENIGKLFVETGEYASLYKQYAQKKLSEKVTALLSGIIVAFVVVLVGGAMLLLLFFALAYWLGDLLGSTPLGFACLTLLALLLLLVVYLCRGPWIVAPITRVVANALDDASVKATPEELEKQLHEHKDSMLNSLHSVTDETKEYNSRAMSASRWVYHIMSLYNGFRIGLSAMTVVNSMLGRTRKRTKK